MEISLLNPGVPPRPQLTMVCVKSLTPDAILSTFTAWMLTVVEREETGCVFLLFYIFNSLLWQHGLEQETS